MKVLFPFFRATPGLVFKLRDCVLTPMELLEQWDAYTIHSVSTQTTEAG
jgi:hypothetical protein